MKWILIISGGGIGSALRFATGLWLAPLFRAFPLATLAVNLVAAAIIGLLVASRRNEEANSLWFFLAVGFCGGLSTFSSFSMETAQLLKAGHLFYAVLNILISVIACVFLSYWLAFGNRG